MKVINYWEILMVLLLENKGVYYFTYLFSVNLKFVICNNSYRIIQENPFFLNGKFSLSSYRGKKGSSWPKVHLKLSQINENRGRLIPIP